MPDLSSYRAVPDQRDALPASRRDMAVERVPAGIESGAGEPAVKGRAARVEHLIPALLPIDRLSRFRPKFLRSFKRPAIGFGVARHGHLLPQMPSLPQNARLLRAAPVRTKFF